MWRQNSIEIVEKKKKEEKEEEKDEEEKREKEKSERKNAEFLTKIIIKWKSFIEKKKKKVPMHRRKIKEKKHDFKI